MISFTLRIKPLSVNEAYKGRRFKTPALKQFQRHMRLILPRAVAKGPRYIVTCHFYLTNCWKRDVDNLIKPLMDCIVKRGIITDDRNVVCYHIYKTWAKEDSIQVEIEPWEEKK